MMAEEQKCQQCGAELPPNAPGGICPKCVMRLALPTDADPEKPAGQYSAWMVLGQKICISLALFFFGNVMSLSGYEAVRGALQPASALAAIRLCMGLIPAVLVVLGLVVFHFFVMDLDIFWAKLMRRLAI